MDVIESRPRAGSLAAPAPSRHSWLARGSPPPASSAGAEGGWTIPRNPPHPRRRWRVGSQIREARRARVPKARNCPRNRDNSSPRRAPTTRSSSAARGATSSRTRVAGRSTSRRRASARTIHRSIERHRRGGRIRDTLAPQARGGRRVESRSRVAWSPGVRRSNSCRLSSTGGSVRRAWREDRHRSGRG